MFEQIMSLSVELIHYLQTNFSWLMPIMRFFTFLGNEEFYLIVMPVFLWAIDYNAGVRLGFIMLFSGSINSIFKFSFHQPRPYWTNSTIANLDTPHNSFGLPSGHSQNAAALFGTLAEWVKSKWLKIVLVITIFLVAISRLFLGVHSLQDIILGLTIGGIIVLLSISLRDKIGQIWQQQTVPAKILIAAAISLTLLFAAVGIASFQQEKNFIPEVWQQNASIAGHETELHPYDIDGVITSCGALFGVIIGSIWVNQTGGFTANQSVWWKYILRFIIGLIGVLVFWKVLGDILPRNGDLLSHSLRYIRYALVGLWITGLSPKIFKWIKIS
jgi:membrane-associated phospholipid phosphatase